MLKKITYLVFISLSLLLFSGCAVSAPQIKPTQPIQQPKVGELKDSTAKAQPTLKRKVAIARFANEAQYGKSNLFGVNTNYNAQKQATDIFSAKLTQSGNFIVLERDDLDLVEKEISKFNLTPNMVGADYLIVGSVTEFGRKTLSDTGVFSRKKQQTAFQ